MTEPIEDPALPEPASRARMAGTPARIALSATAMLLVAAISVVLTLLVSDTGGPKTYTQAEVDAQLAALRAAQPSPSASPTPLAPGTEQIVVTDEGTFVGRCVSGQPLLARWTLNAGYRLPDPSVLEKAKRYAFKITPRQGDPELKPSESPLVLMRPRSGWMAPGGGFLSGLLVENGQNEFIWESFTCKDGVFASGPEGVRYTMKIIEEQK